LANGNDNNGHRAAFWMKVASWTFGLWAVGVPLTGAFIADAVKTVQKEQHELQARYDEWTKEMEARHAIIEERQSVLMRKMEMIEVDHHEYFYEKIKELNDSKSRNGSK
jgi:hypothetical protein